MRRVGTTTGQDLTGVGIVDRSSTQDLLLCTWSPANATALASVAATGIGIDVRAANKKQVENGFTTTTLTASPTPMLKPASTLGLYRILQKDGEIEVDLSFTNFANSLSSLIAGGSKVSKIAALVQSSGGAQVYNVNIVSVVLK